MHVVPVLDLKDGVVVLADGGQRDRYQPIATPLCKDPRPGAVLDAFLGVFGFRAFYIADLDAIEHGSPNLRAITDLARSQPAIEFWLDGGFNRPEHLQPYAEYANIRFVIGSESLDSIETYTALAADPRMRRHILSLDRRNGRDLGPRSLIERPDLWPQTLISMDLAHVGKDAGPGRERLRDLMALRPDIDVAAAGGVRDIDDLEALAADNVHYALVATALHRRKIGGEELARLRGLRKA